MQEQDRERAARSLDQAGVSTSTQMIVNLKTDLGGDQNGSLQVQCMLDAAQQQASLRQVLCRPHLLYHRVRLICPSLKCTACARVNMLQTFHTFCNVLGSSCKHASLCTVCMIVGTFYTCNILGVYRVLCFHKIDLVWLLIAQRMNARICSALLVQVVYETQPRPDLSLYLAPLGGQAADAVMTLNAQAGKHIAINGTCYCTSKAVLFLTLGGCCTHTCLVIQTSC